MEILSNVKKSPQTPKLQSPRLVSAKRLVPISSFCMSGLVAHVDDDDDEEEEEEQGGEEEEHEFYVIGGERSCKNGDIYSGSCLENLPDGTGKYLWSDGCMYEGEWCKGKNTGKGKISWPSGATYEGDFKAGYMHGFGIYTGVDGSTYKGHWEMNEKHGHGRKYYANGDFYEGFWKHGVQEGQGRYAWENGNEYSGEWKGGVMCGRGTLTWANGNKYEGQWLDGCEHGEGVYTWADGSCYIGTWNKDEQDENGAFYPNSKAPPPSLPPLPFNPNKASVKRKPPFQNSQNKSPTENSPVTINQKKSHLRSQTHTASDFCRSKIALNPFENICVWDSDDVTIKIDQDAPIPRKNSVRVLDNAEISMLDRRMERGSLRVFDNKGLDSTAFRSSVLNPKEAKRPGEPIVRGHKNYGLMLSLQLGIRYTVGRITPEPTRGICSADFGPKARIWMKFPSEGSKYTPPHQSVDFKWKDFCPMVFRHLRELFKIDAAEYMLSICGNDALRELSSPGKSGCVFYLTNDDRFMIKTMRKSEVKVLLGMLPTYYSHVRAHESTLITKFFGLHSIKLAGGQKIHFVVMGNILCSTRQIHRRYDLKGSSHGRSTDKIEIDETTTLKDLDLDFVFRLDPVWYQSLMKQIESDCEFLESQKIMDYSLLLGLHFRGPEASKALPATRSPFIHSSQRYSNTIRDENSSGDSANSLIELDQNGELVVSDDNSEHIKAATISKLARQQLGINMPAKAERQGIGSVPDSFPEGEYYGEVYDSLLYFGIIDILQDYDITKRLEHAYKSLQFDALSISAVDPKLYSKRFREFICRIFVEGS